MSTHVKKSLLSLEYFCFCSLLTPDWLSVERAFSRECRVAAVACKMSYDIAVEFTKRVCQLIFA